MRRGIFWIGAAAVAVAMAARKPLRHAYRLVTGPPTMVTCQSKECDGATFILVPKHIKFGMVQVRAGHLYVGRYTECPYCTAPIRLDTHSPPPSKETGPDTF